MASFWPFLLHLLLIGISIGESKRLLPEISVDIGHYIHIKSNDIQAESLRDDDYCILEVLQDDPLYSMVGSVNPKTFPCDFKLGSVSYVHSGAPPYLTQYDYVGLRLYQIPSTTTTYEPEVSELVLPIKIIGNETSFKFLEFKKSLKVDKIKGTSQAFDKEVLGFKLNPMKKFLTCMVSINLQEQNWPKYGKLVYENGAGDQESVDSVYNTCDSFLKAGFKYEHYQPSSPNMDYLPIVIEVLDTNSGIGTQYENVYLPIHIEEATANTAPKFKKSNNPVIIVNNMGFKSLAINNIAAEDSETKKELLIYNISKPLGENEGQIMKRENEKHIPISSFLEKDLEEFKIIYYPPGRDIAHDGETYSFEVTVLDSEYLQSEPLSVEIQMSKVVSKVPWASINQELVVVEGGDAIITENSLKIVDKDNLDDVTVTVREAPEHGSLLVNGRSNKLFSVADIAEGKLMYVHDGSDTKEDQISLTLSDTQNYNRVIFRIKILSVDDTPPKLARVVSLNVNQWSTNAITSDNLVAEDSECPAAMLLYKVVSSVRHGQLVKKYPYDITEVEINQFTQADLVRTLIYYRHGDGQIEDDSFSFYVEDCSGNVSPTSSVDIAVLPNNGKPPKVDQSATHRITVLETEVKAITSNILGFTDSDTKADNIYFHILSDLHFVDAFEMSDAGQLILSDTEPHRAQVYPHIDSFTQLDVEKGRVWYLPPKDDLGMRDREVHLLYEVDDSVIGEASRTVLKTNALNISVLAVDDKPPTAMIKTIEVEDSTFHLILNSDIHVTDIDSPIDSVEIKIAEFPSHGVLNVAGKPADKTVWFNVSYIDQLKLRYEHDGSQGSADRFAFDVRDKANNVRRYWVPITIFHISDHAPVQHKDIQTDLVVKEGGKIIISDYNLKVLDIDTPDERIMYLIVRYPEKGVIKNGDQLVMNNRFSQADVSAGKISYHHSQREIGVSSERDMFQLVFTDQDLPRYDSQHNRIDLSITINPVDNSAPVITTKELDVEEGGHVFITPQALTVHDRDSPASSIGFVVVTQPEWGYLQHTLSGDSYNPRHVTEVVPSFTFGDIDQLRVAYVQNRHKNAEPISDKIVLYATDGKQVSDNYTLPIRINPVSDEEPQFEARNITVTENGFMVLDDIFLSARDMDKPADKLMFYIEEEPMHGYITNRNYSGSYRWLTRDDNVDSFNFEELSKRYISIWYYHDCSENTKDQFTVKLSDGTHSVRHVIHVQIVPINDEFPTIRHSGGVSVKRDQSARLSPLAIIADDVDTPNDQLYFLIRAWPQAGYFLRKEKNHKGEESWVRLTEESNPFTQKEIDEGVIMYKHNSSMNSRLTSDLFAYVVSDGINLSEDASFKISILDDDKSPINLVNNKLTLNAGSKAVITTEYLNADDYANRPSEIIFSIDDPPLMGRVEEIRNPGVAITRFSQAQVANKEIRYAHLMSRDQSVPKPEILDSFNFIVSNGQTWLNKTFEVTVKVSHQLPTLVENKPLQLRQGASKDITIANLHVLDPDTKSRNLTYIIMQKPAEGTLKNGNRTIQYTFTQFDIDNQDITYHHHGTDHIHDDFKFSISDGQNSMYFIKHEVTSKPITFQIDIMVPKPNQLEIKSTINRNLIISDGNIGYRLDSTNIQVKGSDYPPAQIEFKIVRKPIFGKLIYYESGLPLPETFTYDELIRKNIMYVIPPESPATNDSFAFDVQDANGKFTQARSSKSFEEYIPAHGTYDLSWASIEFKQPQMTVCEDGGSIGIRVVRYGWVGGRSQVEFKIKDIPSNMQDDDYFYNRQVVFDEMESEKEIKLEIRRSQDLILNQNIKLIMRRPDNAVLGILTKMDIKILDETDPSCVMGKVDNVMTGSEDSSNYNKHPYNNKNNNGDHPIFPPGGSLDNGGVFVPPMAATLAPTHLPGSYNPFETLKPEGWGSPAGSSDSSPSSEMTAVGSYDRSFMDDPSFIGAQWDFFQQMHPGVIPPANLLNLPHEPPIEWRDCGPLTKNLMQYDRETRGLYLCDGSKWTIATEFNKGFDPDPDVEFDLPREPACPADWTEYKQMCYLVVRSKKTWVQAKHDCEGRDSYLVTVQMHSDEHKNWLLKLTSAPKFWTGLNKMYSMPKKWEWTDGSEVSGNIEWGKTAVDAMNPKSMNQCVNLNDKGNFQTRPCQKPKYPFVCQRKADVYPEENFVYN